MMCLSQKSIEMIGESVLQDYAKRMAGNMQEPIDIERFARTYLTLNIQHRKLSERGTILGLTTYRKTTLELPFSTGNVELTVPENTILLEEKLRHPHTHRRWRFTLAHECAHQILARIEEKETGNSIQKDFAASVACSVRELRSAEDWDEWQANTLAASLLIPRKKLLELLNHRHKPLILTKYGNRFNSLDYANIKWLADYFCVSIKAMEIRMCKLGYIRHKPESEYTDPLEVFDDGWEKDET